MNQPLHLFAKAYQSSLLSRQAPALVVSGRQFTLAHSLDWLDLDHWFIFLGDLFIQVGKQLKAQAACSPVSQK